VTLTVQLVGLANGHDNEGALVFGNGLLVAVLSRLSPQHGASEGRWFLECGFGVVSGCHEEFADIDAAIAWLESQRAKAGSREL
jgi:hypothetical protein